MAKYRHPSKDLGGNWGQGGHWIRTKKRQAIYARDYFRCIWCDCQVTPGVDASLDHVIPRERSGTNDAHNLVTACITCNSSRGEQPPILWLFETQGPGDRYLTLDRLIEAIARPLPGANKEPPRRPRPPRAAKA